MEFLFNNKQCYHILLCSHVKSQLYWRKTPKWTIYFFTSFLNYHYNDKNTYDCGDCVQFFQERFQWEYAILKYSFHFSPLHLSQIFLLYGIFFFPSESWFGDFKKIIFYLLIFHSVFSWYSRDLLCNIPNIAFGYIYFSLLDQVNWKVIWFFCFYKLLKIVFKCHHVYLVSCPIAFEFY